MRFALAYASATYRRPVVVAAPVWTVAPAIIGTPTVGVVCSCTAGTVTGSGVSLTYQWSLDGVDIGGATSVTYTPISGDATHALRRRTPATNAGGTDTSTSAPVTVAAAGGLVNSVPNSPQINDATITTTTITPSWILPDTLFDGSPISGNPITLLEGFYATTLANATPAAGTPFAITNPTDTSKLISGLTTATDYYFIVRPTNGAGVGPSSPPRKFRTA